MKISEIKNHLETDEIILWEKTLTVNLLWEAIKVTFYCLCCFSLLTIIPLGYFIYELIQNIYNANEIDSFRMFGIIFILSCYGVLGFPSVMQRKKIIKKLKKTQENPKEYLHFIILTNNRIIIKNYDNIGKKSSKIRGLTVIKDVALIYFRLIDKVEFRRNTLQFYHLQGKYFKHIIGLDSSFSSDEYKFLLNFIKEYFPFGKFYRSQELMTIGKEYDEMDFG
jgi:hypothetical protein